MHAPTEHAARAGPGRAGHPAVGEDDGAGLERPFAGRRVAHRRHRQPRRRRPRPAASPRPPPPPNPHPSARSQRPARQKARRTSRHAARRHRTKGGRVRVPQGRCMPARARGGQRGSGLLKGTISCPQPHSSTETAPRLPTHHFPAPQASGPAQTAPAPTWPSRRAPQAAPRS